MDDFERAVMLQLALAEASKGHRSIVRRGSRRSPVRAVLLQVFVFVFFVKARKDTPSFRPGHKKPGAALPHGRDEIRHAGHIRLSRQFGWSGGVGW